MPNSLKYQVYRILRLVAQTRLRTLCVFGLAGLFWGVLFLFLSLKVADSTLNYNPYRWMSKPHEWLMLVGLVLDLRMYVWIKQVRPTVPHLVVLFCLAHVFAATLFYGVVAVLVRETVVRIRSFNAKRRGSRP